MARSPSDIAKQLRRIAAGIAASTNPDRAKVARALKSVIAAVSGDASAICQALYGHSDGNPSALIDYDPEFDPRGSSLFWVAFKELGITDWYPGMDPQPIFAKTNEIAERYRAEGLNSVDPGQAVKMAQKNHADYVSYVEPEHIEQLKAAGLWT